MMDNTRIIVCDDCTFRLVTTHMKDAGQEMPEDKAQRLSKLYKKRRKGTKVRKLKSTGKKNA